MSRTIGGIVFLILGLLFWCALGCQSESPTTEPIEPLHRLGVNLRFFSGDGATAKIDQKIRSQIDPAAFGVVTIAVSVTGPAGELITNSFPYSPGGFGRVLNVPSGNLLVEVRALDANGSTVFFGSTLVLIGPETTDTEINALTLFQSSESATPLTILQISTTPSTQSADIQFLTNLPATSALSFGSGTVLAQQTTISGLPVNNHHFTLPSLAPNTLYSFQISATANGITAQSAIQTFQTLANPTVASATPSPKPAAILTINNGATTTSSSLVTLSLSSVIGVGILEMSIDGGAYQPLSTSMSYILPGGTGLKTVTLLLRDSGGVISDPITATIQFSTNPLTVVSTIPANLASGISRSQVVQVTFNQPIDLSSVNSSSFQFAPSGGWEVPGGYSLSGNSLLFTPNYPLVEGFYMATLTTAIRNSGGIPLAKIATFGFSVTPALMVLDINGGGAHSNPLDLIAVGPRVVFSATTGASGYEIFSSDGTPGNTGIVTDINIGVPNSSPGFLYLFNGLVYFSANNGVMGLEPWSTDGTAGNTSNLTDIDLGATGSSPSLFHENTSLGLLFYRASTTALGTELGVTDGTVGGTLQIDIEAGAGSSLPGPFASLGSKVYFGATTAVAGTELMESDGTAIGTTILADIFAGGANDSSPGNLSSNGSLILFKATNGADGNELWKTDGTLVGTVMVKDINPGAPSSNPGKAVFGPGGLAFFIANDGVNGPELWATNGTGGGTLLVKDINPGAGSISNSYIYYYTSKNIIIFDANDGSCGSELWRSDGTPGGTIRIRDINPGILGSTPGYLREIGGLMYFAATTASFGREPWQTDGTSSGTLQIMDINFGASNSGPNDFTALGTNILFGANNGATFGYELWKFN